MQDSREWSQLRGGKPTPLQATDCNARRMSWPASSSLASPLTISCTTQGRPALMAVRSSCTVASSVPASWLELPSGGCCRNLQAGREGRGAAGVAFRSRAGEA